MAKETFEFEYTTTTKKDGRRPATPDNLHTTRHLIDRDDNGKPFNTLQEVDAHLLGFEWDNLKVFRRQEMIIPHDWPKTKILECN